MANLKQIAGGIAEDHRGQIRFVNDFDMSEVKRFYIITNKDTELIRGWRAHRIEQRWFYVIRGCFRLDVVKIDDWEKISGEIQVENIILRADDQQVIHLPAGYGTAFQAMEDNSELLVFADKGIDHAPYDDYTFPIGYFSKRQSGI